MSIIFIGATAFLTVYLSKKNRIEDAEITSSSETEMLSKEEACFLLNLETNLNNKISSIMKTEKTLSIKVGLINNFSTIILPINELKYSFVRIPFYEIISREDLFKN